MVQLGELSVGRQALEGASLAPGDKKTLEALKDPDRRPVLPRNSVPDDISQFAPVEEFSSRRSARPGAAPGPSGMTADHVRPLLEAHGDTAALSHAASLLARNEMLEEVMVAIRCRRITALQKPDGGVRGIVVGDIFRRFVARTIAQQFRAKVEVATSPHQHALKTKAGCETVAHILQALTDFDGDATVVCRRCGRI